MSRITGSRSSYGHNWKRIGPNEYRLSWSFDTRIAGSRQRWPRTIARYSNEDGALRFAKKWGLTIPTKEIV